MMMDEIIRDIKLESLGDVLECMEKSKIDLCLDVFDLMKQNYKLRNEIKTLKIELDHFKEYQEECDSYHSQ